MANAADRKSIRAQEKLAEREARERGEVVAKLAATPQGRAYLWSKLEAAHVFQTSFSSDPLAMSFAEGERNQGLILLNDVITYCPEQFIQMMVENNVRRSARSPADTRTDDTDSVPDTASGERTDSEGPERDDSRSSSGEAGYDNIVDYTSVDVRPKANGAQGG